MNGNDGLEALRRANPRATAGYAEAVGAARRARSDLLVDAGSAPEPVPRRTLKPRAVPRLRWLGFSAASVGVIAAAAVAALALGTAGSNTGGTPGGVAVRDPAAALRKAAVLTSAASDQSGKAAVRVAKDGQPWAGKTVNWNGDDIAVVDDAPPRPGTPGREFRVVDRIFYGPNPEGDGWLAMGSPENIDPDSGTTPLEILAAVREDTAGDTFDRITGGMTDLQTQTGEDGAVTYSGKVAAGLVAMEEAYKEGENLRVLPYGYVAHDAAANPASQLDVSLTVGSDGLIRTIAAIWGGGSAWTYTVTFSDLGTAPPIEPPPNAQSLEDFRKAERSKHPNG
jgi:hypothetical protein